MLIGLCAISAIADDAAATSATPATPATPAADEATAAVVADPVVTAAPVSTDPETLKDLYGSLDFDAIQKEVEADIRSNFGDYDI